MVGEGPTAPRAEQRANDDKAEVVGDLNIPVTAIVNVRPGKRVPHPFHESSTGCNFMINANDQTWRCWRHSFTGNALHLLGIKYSIISCGEKPSKEQWRKIIGKARKEGLVKAQLRIYEGRRGT